MFSIQILSVLAFGLAHAATPSVTPADLAALDQLECYAENPLIPAADDLTLIAQPPANAPLWLTFSPRLTYRFGRWFTGAPVAHDLSLPRRLRPGSFRRDEIFFRITLADADGGEPPARGELKSRFRAGVAELLARGYTLRCAYDVAAWADAKFCVDPLSTAPAR